MPQRWVSSECYPKCESPKVNVVRFLKRYEMIRSHISSIQECGVILKLERFSHLSDWSFGLSYSIGLETLPLVLSLRADT